MVSNSLYVYEILFMELKTLVGKRVRYSLLHILKQNTGSDIEASDTVVFVNTMNAPRNKVLFLHTFSY